MIAYLNHTKIINFDVVDFSECLSKEMKVSFDAKCIKNYIYMNKLNIFILYT